MNIQKIKLSLLFLIGANLVPLVGIFSFEWSLFSVLFFYWLETVVVGLLNIPKMLMAKGKDKALDHALREAKQSKNSKFIYSTLNISIVPLFLFHFGMFVFVHAVFLFGFYEAVDIPLQNIGIAIGVFLVSHGYSFFRNFIGNKEYAHRSMKQQMMQPYTRVVILHLAILFGAFPLMIFRSSIWAVLILIILKTGIDIVLHLREHRVSHV